MTFSSYNKVLEVASRKASESFALKYLTPTNIAEQKAQFFKKQKYNPVFTYSIPEIEVNDEISINHLPKGTLKELVREKLFAQRQLREIARSKNESEFTKRSIAHFGKPNTETVEIAHAILSKSKEKYNNTELLTFEEIIKIIEAEIKRSNLPAELIISKNESFKNKISASKKAIIISRDYKADIDEVSDLLAHELGTHIRRNINGESHPFILFRMKSAQYLPAEEGLATLMGHAVRKTKLLIHPALLIIAIQTALQADFYTTYTILLDLIGDKEEAFMYTLRAKRGLINTAQTGAFTKDRYLDWVIETGRKIIQNPQYLDTAFLGKGSLEELYEFSGGKSNPRYLKTDQIKEIFLINGITL